MSYEDSVGYRKKFPILWLRPRYRQCDTPDEIAARRECILAVRQALSEIPPEQAGLLVVRYCEGMTLRDLAKWEGVGVSAVSERIKAAARRFRVALRRRRPDLCLTDFSEVV